MLFWCRLIWPRPPSPVSLRRDTVPACHTERRNTKRLWRKTTAKKLAVLFNKFPLRIKFKIVGKKWKHKKIIDITRLFFYLNSYVYESTTYIWKTIIRSSYINKSSIKIPYLIFIVRTAISTDMYFLDYDPRRRTWTGDFKCREVKTGFYRNRSMQTGSSGTLIGWKSGQTTFVPLWDWMEGAWLRTPDKERLFF